MTIISAKLFKALKQAGVDENLAEEASSEVAQSSKIVLEQKNDITELKSNIKEFKAEAISDIKELKAKINILIALNVSLLAAILVSMIVK